VCVCVYVCVCVCVCVCDEPRQISKEVIKPIFWAYFNIFLFSVTSTKNKRLSHITGPPEYEVEQRTSRNLFLGELMSHGSPPACLNLILISFMSVKWRVTFYVDNKKSEVTFDNCITSYVFRLFILLN
jgi:hypothetical protein